MDKQRKILHNPDILSIEYLPEKILYREKEREQLIDNLKNKIHTVILGPFGSGKTTLVKSVIKEYNKSYEGQIVYVDCSLYPTTYSILKEVLPSSQLVFYRSNYELTRELKKYAKKNKFSIALDNFNHLKEKDLIARFMKLNLCVVLISDKIESFKSLDIRIKSNITGKIKLPRYSTEQSMEILRNRADKALKEWSYSNEILEKISVKIKGNITMGVNALKAAAIKAEREGKQAIEKEDVQIEINNSNPRLNMDETLLLKIMEEQRTISPQKLYSSYAEKANEPKSKRAFRNYMQNLCSKGLVRPIGEKKGRTYQIIDHRNLNNKNSLKR